MAGTLPGIPLSQQFSAIGQPLAGCLLYIYAANTTTPQDSFLDQGLTIKNPWPLVGDNSGRVPMFYLADGSVHVRLTDSGGVVQFDYPSMMVVGPSSGGTGPPPPGVDPNAIFQTGDCVWFETGPLLTTRPGWVRDNGRTISKAGASGQERADPDCQALFVFLWNNYSDTICPVIGGRGATGIADFNAGKQITLPDKRGYSPVGDTAMGNADTAALASVPVIAGNATTSGSKVGEATHTLLVAELATFTPTFHQVPQYLKPNVTSQNLGIGAPASAFNVFDVPATTTTNTANATFDSIGSNVPHNNTPLMVVGTFYRKL